MVNNNEKEKENNELIQEPTIETTNVSPTAFKKNDNKNHFILGLIAAIAVIALFVTAYTVYLNLQLQKQHLNKHNDLLTQLSQLKDTITKNQEQFEVKNANSEQTQNSLQNEINSLKTQLQTSLSQLQLQNQDWILLKARYYLELAQINTNWSDNYKSTISLLQLADTLLKQVNDPKILNIRQAIAKEINEIKAIPLTDTAGLLSQLDAAQMSLSNLSIQSPVESNKEGKPDETVTSSSPAWKLRLQDSMRLLEKLVVIRRDNEDIKPLLSPLFESTLKESIRLNLQEAQWAILNNNAAIYQLALKQAISNIKRVFDKTDQKTIELLKQLDTLQQVKLTQEKPVIGQTLPLLNQLIDNRESQLKPLTDNAKGESTQ